MTDRKAWAASPFVIEEKPICRLAILNLVAEVADLGPADCAQSLADGLEALPLRQTNLLLVDLFSIGFDFEGLRQLVSAAKAPTIAIDDRPNPSFAAITQTAGASGYISKNSELDVFRAVIRAVVDGGEHFPREASEAPRRGRSSGAVLGLSPRQLDVLKCIAVGMSNGEIARSLGITAGTVKLHIHAILRLTGARNRTEAALIAGRFLAPTIDG